MESEFSPEGPVTKLNIGRLTNAIFAFTLLLLFKNVRMPSFSDYVAGTVNAGEFGYMQVPDIFSFLNAFLIIAMIWVITFHLFHQLTRVDRLYIYLHLALVMMVIFIPVSSHMNVMFPGKSVFPVLFHANMLMVGTLLAFLWWHISSESSIRRAGIGRVQMECTTMKILYIPATSVAGMVLANLDLGYTQGIYLGTMIAFVLTTLYSRRRERIDQGASK